MVEATLALMREALRDPATRYLALLSGAHLPLRPTPEVASFLFDGREHIELTFAAMEPIDQKSLRRFWYRALPGRGPIPRCCAGATATAGGWASATWRAGCTA